MKDEQLAVITAIMSGMQLAVVHLATVVASKAGIDKDDLAASFEETANGIPLEVKNREAVQMGVRQIAQGIRGAATGLAWDDLMSRLKH
jgi:hypothetical protein